MKPAILLVALSLVLPAAGCAVSPAGPRFTGAIAADDDGGWRPHRAAYRQPGGERGAVRASGRATYAATIAREAASNGVPADLALAMVTIESNYNPGLTGRAGEIGLMQIKLETARSLGYSGDRAGLYDPATNIRYGMKYLGEAHRLAQGDVCGTVLRYQGGLRATRHSAWTRQSCGRARDLMRA